MIRVGLVNEYCPETTLVTASERLVPGATVQAVAGIPISTVLIDNSIPGSPRFTLAFTSVVGKNYQVLFSDDQMQTWALADTLTANSTWTIWTELLPPASGNRFFKVIVLP